MFLLEILFILLIQAQELGKDSEPTDPLKTYVQIGSLITAIVGLLAILFTKTWPWLKAKTDRRSIQKRIGAELFSVANIENSIRHYIQPYCQSIDPAGGEEPGAIFSAKQDLFRALDEALNHPTEYRYLIVLADSGMGKTSALINYYVRHLRRLRCRFDLALIPLGIPDADERITDIQNKSNTVLLLDALDEDTLAIVDHVDRIRMLLKLTRDFARVVITCRTQFFPKDEEIPQETGILKVGARAAGERAEYIFHKLYLSPFTDEQVKKYLKRRYPIWREFRRRRAQEMIRKIPSLTARPMLLAHVDDLVQANHLIKYSFELYEEMIEAWLKREEGFIKAKDQLREFSKLLAVNLYVNRRTRGAERVPRSELSALAQEWNIPLDDWKLGGRSLLNRDAQGNYKFAHRSVMEYLFVKAFTEGDNGSSSIEWTDQMYRFLVEMLRRHLETNSDNPINDQEFGLIRISWNEARVSMLSKAIINSDKYLPDDFNHLQSLNLLVALAEMILRESKAIPIRSLNLLKVQYIDPPLNDAEDIRFNFSFVTSYPKKSSKSFWGDDLLVRTGIAMYKSELDKYALTIRLRSDKIVGVLIYAATDRYYTAWGKGEVDPKMLSVIADLSLLIADLLENDHSEDIGVT